MCMHASSSATDQIILNLGDSLIRKDIAFVEEQEDGSLSFSFLEGINDSVIYPSKLGCC